MSILRFIAVFFIGLSTLSFVAHGEEETPGSFKMELPFDRVATITPILRKLADWCITPAEFKQEAMAALKADVAYNPRSDLTSVVFRKQTVLGTRGRGKNEREVAVCVEHKVGQFAVVEIKKVE